MIAPLPGATPTKPGSAVSVIFLSSAENFYLLSLSSSGHLGH